MPENPAMVLATTPEARTLVSCLMVTQPSRLAHLVTSITDFCRQSHTPRELVVVVRDAPGTELEQIAGYIESLNRTDIRLLTVPAATTLGGLRNRSLDEAAGAVVCQWDDDDRHHPARIAEQLAALRRSRHTACALQDIFQFFSETRLMHWTNWSMTPARVHPGTVMADRRAGLRYPESGPEASMGEDLAAVAELQRRDGVEALAGAPHLFIYVTHGANTWSASHHRMLADSLSLSRALLLRREAQIRTGLDAFDFGPGDITMAGSNGSAFTLRRPDP